MSTAIEYRAKAAAADQAAIDSFDRCDTDGFMSQWAHEVMAGKYRAEAELAEAGGMWEFEALANAEGALVPAKVIQTKYGYSWGVFATFEEAEAYGSKIVEWVSMSVSDKTLAKKGYQKVAVKSEGRVKSIGEITIMHVIVPAVAVFTPANCEII